MKMKKAFGWNPTQGKLHAESLPIALCHRINDTTTVNLAPMKESKLHGDGNNVVAAHDADRKEESLQATTIHPGSESERDKPNIHPLTKWGSVDCRKNVSQKRSVKSQVDEIIRLSKINGSPRISSSAPVYATPSKDDLLTIAEAVTSSETAPPSTAEPQKSNKSDIDHWLINESRRLTDEKEENQFQLPLLPRESRGSDLFLSSSVNSACSNHFLSDRNTSHQLGYMNTSNNNSQNSLGHRSSNGSSRDPNRNVSVEDFWIVNGGVKSDSVKGATVTSDNRIRTESGISSGLSSGISSISNQLVELADVSDKGRKTPKKGKNNATEDSEDVANDSDDNDCDYSFFHDSGNFSDDGEADHPSDVIRNCSTKSEKSDTSSSIGHTRSRSDTSSVDQTVDDHVKGKHNQATSISSEYGSIFELLAAGGSILGPGSSLTGSNAAVAISDTPSSAALQSVGDYSSIQMQQMLDFHDHHSIYRTDTNVIHLKNLSNSHSLSRSSVYTQLPSTVSMTACWDGGPASNVGMSDSSNLGIAGGADPPEGSTHTRTRTWSQDSGSILTAPTTVPLSPPPPPALPHHISTPYHSNHQKHQGPALQTHMRVGGKQNLAGQPGGILKNSPKISRRKDLSDVGQEVLMNTMTNAKVNSSYGSSSLSKGKLHGVFRCI